MEHTLMQFIRFSMMLLQSNLSKMTIQQQTGKAVMVNSMLLQIQFIDLELMQKLQKLIKMLL